MSEQSVPPVDAGPSREDVPVEEDTQGHARRFPLPDDEDDVEGHGLGLTLAVSGAIVLGTAAVGTATQMQVAPAPGWASDAVPSPQPGEAPAVSEADTAPQTTVASTVRIGGMIHSGVYVVPVTTTSVHIESV